MRAVAFRKRLDKGKLIEEIVQKVIESLFDLHNVYSPTLPISVNVDTNFSNKEVSKQAKKKGQKYAKDIVKYYQSYGVSIQIPDAEFKDGRYVFSVTLLPGTDEKLIKRYVDEIRRLLRLEFFSISMDNSVIKIVASEKPLEEINLLKILNSPEFKENKMKIPYAVGYDMMGEMVIADVAEFPHMLTPVVTEIEKGWQCILILREIMEDRLKIFNSIDPRDRNSQLKKWPFIICIIDEFPNFIMELSAGKNNKMSYMLLMDLLARARKVKIHLILAAQDASRGNISIKNTNIRAAIAFECTNWRESKDIIGVPGAENLFGVGSMYFKCYQHQGIRRVQGSYLPPEKIMHMLDLKFKRSDIVTELHDAPRFDFKSLTKLNVTEPELDDLTLEDTRDKKLAEIIMWALGRDKISNKQIKDKYHMGYGRAKDFLKDLETLGIVTKQQGESKLRRDVTLKKLEDILAKDDLVKYLEEYGYTKTDIKNALNQRKNS